MANNQGLTSWDIAVGVCGGLLMAGFISSVGMVLVLYAMAHGMRLSIDSAPVSQITLPTVPAAQIEERTAAPVVPQQHLVTVPAGTVEDCLRDSNGVADIAFAKCRKAHQDLRY